MLVLLIGLMASKSVTYIDGITVPCDYIDNCEACAFKGGSKVKSTFLICASRCYLELNPKTNQTHVCKPEPTPVPETPEPDTPTPEPETPPPTATPMATKSATPKPTSTPENCPPCVCDTALKASTLLRALITNTQHYWSCSV